MLKQIFAILSCLLLLIVFLVIFGGFAFIDFAIKLMWLAFSFLITFICNNLNITFIVDRMNKFLSKYSLTVAETPKVRGDSITFYNMQWKDEKGNLIRLPQVEVRIDAYRVVLDYFKENREKRLFEDIKEITIRQPQLEFALEPNTALSLPATFKGDNGEVEQNKQLLMDSLLALKVRMNVENGTLKLKTGEQLIEFDSIGGQLVNEPAPQQEGKGLFNLHLNCLYEGENISLHNHDSVERFVLNGSKIVLPKIWKAAKLWLPVVPDELELQEGKLTDLRIALKAHKWHQLKLEELDFRLEECALSCAGIKIENLEGSFHTSDVRSVFCRKLLFDINEQAFRLKGKLSLGEHKGHYNYDIRAAANSYTWKNNMELHILPGFGINGMVAVERRNIKLLLNMNEESAFCLHSPNINGGTICSLKGELTLAGEELSFEEISCRLNERPIKLSQGWYQLNSDEYGFKAKGEELESILISDAPVSGRISGELEANGNLRDKWLSIKGSYQVSKLVYEKWKPLNLGEGTLSGKLSWQGSELQLVDNKLHFAKGDISVPSCRFENGKLKIEFPNWKDYLGDKLDSVKERIKISLGENQEEKMPAEKEEEGKNPVRKFFEKFLK